MTNPIIEKPDQSTSPPTIPPSVIFDSIPQAMRDAPRWVLWKYEERDGKKTKVPYFDEVTRARSNDPSTWRRFDEAVKYCVRFPIFGLGFQLGSGWTGIDIDHCRENPESEWNEADLNAALMWNSYAEVSPSGSGIHVIVKGSLKPGLDRRRGNREIYDSGRYFTVTGDHLARSSFEVRALGDEEVSTLYNLFLPPKEEKQGSAVTKVQSTPETGNDVSTPLDNDRDLIKKAVSAKNGKKFLTLWEGDISEYTSKSEADLAFVSLISFWTQDKDQINRIFRTSGLSCEKWDRDDYREKTIAMALKSVKPRPPGKNKKEKPNENETPYKTLSFFEKNRTLYLDVIDANEKHCFVHLENGSLVFEESGVDERGIEIRPQVLPVHQDTGVVVHIVGLPELERLQEADLLPPIELYEMITTHIRRFIDAPDIEIELFTYFVLYTWFYRKCSNAPYLRFLADTGKGKSRMLKVISDLCFYPIQAGGASTQSGIMRFKERWNGTLVIDEADLRGGVDDPIVKYLNLGFESEKYYLLTDKNDLSKQEIFDPFSPKVIAMREPFKDNATEGRVLSFSPHETMRKDIPIELTKSYGQDINVIRAHIALFVLYHWPRINGEDLISCAGMNIEPRLQQMARPLSIIFQVFPDGEARFMDYLQKRQQDIKKVRAESWEGAIFNQALSIATGDDDLSEDSEYSQLFRGNEIQALTAKMVAAIFKSSVKGITRALSSIGFDVEFDHIDVLKKTDNGWTTRRKSVRKLVVPTQIAWTEITRRYFYSEDGKPAPPCPEVIRGKRFQSSPSPACVPYGTVPSVPSVPLSITDYGSGTLGTLGTDVLGTETPKKVPEGYTSSSIETPDNPSAYLNSVPSPTASDHSATGAGDHSYTPSGGDVPSEGDIPSDVIEVPEDLPLPDLLTTWDLPPIESLKGHIHMRACNHRCMVKGCTYKGDVVWKANGAFPVPLCDRHYEALRKKGL